MSFLEHVGISRWQAIAILTDPLKARLWPCCKRKAERPNRSALEFALGGSHQRVLPMSKQERHGLLPRLWRHPRRASSPRTATTIAPMIADQRPDPTKRTSAQDRATTALLLDWLRADRRCRRYLVPGADRPRQNAWSECASSKLISRQYGQIGKRRPLINLT